MINKYFNAKLAVFTHHQNAFGGWATAKKPGLQYINKTIQRR